VAPSPFFSSLQPEKHGSPRVNGRDEDASPVDTDWLDYKRQMAETGKISSPEFTAVYFVTALERF